MGNNYYLVCKSCGHHIHHIGKQSTGHPFYSDWTIGEVAKWLTEKVEIQDEYGKVYSWEQFIKNRRWELRAEIHESREEQEMQWS